MCSHKFSTMVDWSPVTGYAFPDLQCDLCGAPVKADEWPYAHDMDGNMEQDISELPSADVDAWQFWQNKPLSPLTPERRAKIIEQMKKEIGNE